MHTRRPAQPQPIPTSEKDVVILIKLAQDGDVDSLEGTHQGAISLVEVGKQLQDDAQATGQGSMGRSRVAGWMCKLLLDMQVAAASTATGPGRG